jgi:hypothetical protein
MNSKLLNCSKCRHLVAKVAPKCPGCGTPPQMSAFKKWACGIAILVVGLTVLVILTPDEKPASPPSTAKPVGSPAISASDHEAAPVESGEPPPATELSRTAGKLTMNMSRSEVIEKLGAPPAWVLLPGDPLDRAPKEEGMLVKLIWKNGLCAPVVADFDADQKLIGWDEGRWTCAETEAEIATFLPPAGKYGCDDTRRSIYCRGAVVQSDAVVSETTAADARPGAGPEQLQPPTDQEKAKAIEAFCTQVVASVRSVLAGKTKVDDIANSPTTTLLRAEHQLSESEGIDEMRAVQIMGAADDDLKATNPSGNYVTYCLARR